MAWFEASTPVLSQLGATMGRGLSSAGGGADYSSLFENMAAEQRRQADRDYGLKKRQLDQEYQIARQNARTARERLEIDRWYNQQQVKIAGERLAEERRQFDLTHGLNQARLGYDLLGMQAQLRGPSNYFQAAEFARGVANNPGTATFLSALRNNTNLAGFGAQAGVPDKETLGTLTAKLGGGLMPGTGATSPGSAPNDTANLAAIRNLYAQGAHRLGAGSLEQLTGTELELLKSGIDASGGDIGTFLDQYRRSRVGQGLANSAAA